MITCVVAYEVDDRSSCSSRVVQIGDAISKASAQVQQRCCGPARHAAKTVSGSRANTLKQAENSSHFGHGVDGVHEVHFGRTRIREANIDTALGERSQKAFGTSHGLRVHQLIPHFVARLPKSSNCTPPARLRESGYFISVQRGMVPL